MPNVPNGTTSALALASVDPSIYASAAANIYALSQGEWRSYVQNLPAELFSTFAPAAVGIPWAVAVGAGQFVTGWVNNNRAKDRAKRIERAFNEAIRSHLAQGHHPIYAARAALRNASTRAKRPLPIPNALRFPGEAIGATYWDPIARHAQDRKGALIRYGVGPAADAARARHQAAIWNAQGSQVRAAPSATVPDLFARRRMQ